jgi:hypothetical protein
MVFIRSGEQVDTWGLIPVISGGKELPVNKINRH